MIHGIRANVIDLDMIRSYASAVQHNTASASMASSSSITIDINHPYYLSSSDHPGLSLVSEILIGSNYYH